MKKKNILLILMTLFAVCFISGCKQNVGTPEDNAVVKRRKMMKMRPAAMCTDSAEQICQILFMRSSKNLSAPWLRKKKAVCL